MTTLDSLIDWKKVSKTKELDEEFLRKYAAFVDFHELCQNKKITLSLSFIRDYEDKIDFELINHHQKLADDVVDHYFDKFSLIWLISRNNLSEANARKYFNKLKKANYLPSLMHYINFSMSFLEDFFDELPKLEMSEHQKLSKAFIKKHVKELDWNNLHRNKYIRKEWLKEIQQEMRNIKYGK
jgi:hypothetical protein